MQEDPLPSWHHPHQTDQTTSLCPFWTDVVFMQNKVCQGGVLFEAFSQSLAVDTWLEKNDEGRCPALLFSISLTSLSNSCVLIRPHPYQTPSLRPFISDVVAPQIQQRQGGVLLQGLGQRLEGQETHELRNTMKHTAHIIPQTCKILIIALLIQKFRFHAGRPTLPGQLTAWLKKWPHYIQLVSWTCQVILTADIAQPQTNKWPVHPHLSRLIPLLPYTHFPSWESSFQPLQHPFHGDDMPWS